MPPMRRLNSHSITDLIRYAIRGLAPSIYETGRSELSKNRVFTVSSSMVPCVIMEWLVANSISPAGLSGRLKQISNALNEFPPAVRLGNYAARTCSYCQGAAHGIVIHRE